MKLKRIQRTFLRGTCYFGFNGPIYWVHLDFGRWLGITIGTKKLERIRRGG